jgi:plastocyanin
MSHTTRRLAVAAACLVAFATSACSSDSKSGTATTTAGSSAPVGLTIQNSSFSAASVTAGTEFTVENKDSVTHTVTPDDAGAFTAVRVPGHGTMPLTITAPGTYKIHCEIHGSMHGTITVT